MGKKLKVIFLSSMQPITKWQLAPWWDCKTMALKTSLPVCTKTF
jgi:hypothetical protein